MATKIWRGTAKSVPQVDKVYPTNINPGDTLTVTVNRKDIDVVASKLITDQTDLIADVVNKFVTAIGQYSNDEPEWAEVSAAAGNNDVGDTDHVVITGPTDGKPFTLTATGTQLALDVDINEAKKGVAAVAAQTYSISRGPAVEIKEGQDGALGQTKLTVTRTAQTTDTQWRLTLRFEPESTSFTTAWLSSSAATSEVAYALEEIGFAGDVTINSDGDYEIILIDSVEAIRTTNLDASIESRDGSYSVAASEIDFQNEVQYFRLSATSGNFTMDGETLDANASALFDASGVGSIPAALVAAGTISDTSSVTLSSIAAGASGWSVTDQRHKWWKFTFSGDSAATDIPKITVADVSLAGTVSDTVTTAEAIAGVNEVQEVRFNREPTGGTFTLTYDSSTTGNIAYNASAATVQTALEGTTGISSGDVSVTGPAGGPWLVEFTGTLAETDVDMMTGSGASLTGGLSTTNTASTTTSPAGPNWWSVADNWYNPAAPSTPTAPAASDDVIFRSNEVDCLYGLDANTGDTLSSLTIEASFTGQLGLPLYTGQYYEYRVRRLEAGITTVEIGKGRGLGSNRIYLDLESVASTVTVLSSASSLDDDAPIQITGTSTSNVYRILSGQVGIGVGEPSDVPAGAMLTIGSGSDQQAAADVLVSAGTITTIEQIGGESDLRCSATTLNLRAGDATVQGSGTFGTVNCDANLDYRGTGTTTTANIGPTGELSLTNASVGATFTNLNVYSGGTLIDPWLKGTYTGGIDLVRCGLEDVTLQLGSNITLTRTAL